jgi:tetratricopeptide (TPR) repeat protein
MKYQMLACAIVAAAVAGCASRTSDDLYLRGQLEAEQGNLALALEHLSGAIKQDSRMGMAFIARADIYKQQGNYEQAAADYAAAARLEPYNFNANFKLGEVLQILKRYAEAITAYQQALQSHPLDYDANMNLAMTYLQAGEPMSGVYYGKKAVDNNDRSPTAHANLGVLYAQIEYHANAIDEFKRSLELDSHQPEVYVNLAQEYFTDKKYDQARNVLETAQNLAPSAKVWDRLGFAYHMLREEEKASSAFKEALKIDNHYYPSLNGLGVVAMSQAVSSNPVNVELAKQGLGYWNESLEIKKDQPVIQELVNKYAPKQ